MRKGFALKGVCNVCKFSSNMVLQPYRTGGCYAQRRDTLQDFIAVNLYGSRIDATMYGIQIDKLKFMKRKIYAN